MNPNSLKKKKIIGIKSVQFRIVLNESNKNIFIPFALTSSLLFFKNDSNPK